MLCGCCRQWTKAGCGDLGGLTRVGGEREGGEREGGEREGGERGEGPREVSGEQRSVPE